MKVNNHSDSVDISSMARTKRGDKAAAAKKAQETAATGESGSVGATANVEISGEAKALATANQVARSENVDQAKIDRIKAMINGGSYKPDMGKVADKMLTENLLQDIS